MDRVTNCPNCDARISRQIDVLCGAQMCDRCGWHVGLVRCFCGWSAYNEDGRQELLNMGENIDRDY